MKTKTKVVKSQPLSRKQLTVKAVEGLKPRMSLQRWAEHVGEATANGAYRVELIEATAKMFGQKFYKRTENGTENSE